MASHALAMMLLMPHAQSFPSQQHDIKRAHISPAHYFLSVQVLQENGVPAQTLVVSGP